MKGTNRKLLDDRFRVLWNVSGWCRGNGRERVVAAVLGCLIVQIQPGDGGGNNRRESRTNRVSESCVAYASLIAARKSGFERNQTTPNRSAPSPVSYNYM
jgi:hypothetical protein